MILVFFVLYIVFRFTCDIVDEYIAESIVYITKWMKLTESLAGVTLLALANGALANSAAANLVSSNLP